MAAKSQLWGWVRRLPFECEWQLQLVNCTDLCFASPNSDDRKRAAFRLFVLQDSFKIDVMPYLPHFDESFLLEAVPFHKEMHC
ncbi:hypothetical protein TNCV_1452191 [Trichonephila clavipes]|nr:hypothetical protein TNCV_1452191 [Trichonephila clavipes]